jgi:uncharacterized membrane protein
MALVYGLIGLAIAYFGLRNSRSVGRHVLVIAGAMVAVAFMAAAGFQIFHPAGGDRAAMNARNAAIPVEFAMGIVALIVGPLAGTIIASIGRKKRTATR